jgi:hypothetical protein
MISRFMENVMDDDRPFLEKKWGHKPYGDNGYPRASDLILGKALKGRSGHQFRDARRDRFSISSFQLADLGGKADNALACVVAWCMWCTINASFRGQTGCAPLPGPRVACVVAVIATFRPFNQLPPNQQCCASPHANSRGSVCDVTRHRKELRVTGANVPNASLVHLWCIIGARSCRAWIDAR